MRDQEVQLSDSTDVSPRLYASSDVADVQGDHTDRARDEAG